jgi:hypothetical protein
MLNGFDVYIRKVVENGKSSFQKLSVAQKKSASLPWRKGLKLESYRASEKDEQS